jgi:hypothetical protein
MRQEEQREAVAAAQENGQIGAQPTVDSRLPPQRGQGPGINIVTMNKVGDEIVTTLVLALWLSDPHLLLGETYSALMSSALPSLRPP